MSAGESEALASTGLGVPGPEVEVFESRDASSDPSGIGSSSVYDSEVADDGVVVEVGCFCGIPV